MGKMGKIGKIGKMGGSPKIPQNAKNAPKCQKWGNWGFCPNTPKMGFLAATVTNTPGRLDMIIIFKITPVSPFYTLLLRVSILHFL